MPQPRYSKEDRNRRQAAVQTVRGGLQAGVGATVGAQGVQLAHEYGRLAHAHRENAGAYVRLARSHYVAGDPFGSAIHLAQVPKHKVAAQTAVRLGRGIALPLAAGGAILTGVGAKNIVQGQEHAHRNRKEFGKSAFGLGDITKTDVDDRRKKQAAGGAAAAGAGGAAYWLWRKRKKRGYDIPLGGDGGHRLRAPSPPPMLPSGGVGGDSLHGFRPSTPIRVPHRL